VERAEKDQILQGIVHTIQGQSGKKPHEMGIAFPNYQADRSLSPSMSISPSPQKQVTTLEQKRIKRKVLRVFETEGSEGLTKKMRDGVDLPVPKSLLDTNSIEGEL